MQDYISTAAWGVQPALHELAGDHEPLSATHSPHERQPEQCSHLLLLVSFTHQIYIILVCGWCVCVNSARYLNIIL